MADTRYTPTDLKLAWIAGFLDGEGCFTIEEIEDRRRLIGELEAIRGRAA